MEKLKKVIVLKLKEQRYGVDIQNVLSIEKLEKVTPIPRTSQFIKGMINLHNQIIPLIDLKERLRIGKTVSAEETRIIIVGINDIPVGLIVDSATDVLDIDSDLIDDAPAIVGEVSATFINGVAKLPDELLILLNIDHILSLEELNEVKKVTED